MQTMTSVEIDQVAGGAVAPLSLFLSLLSQGQGYGDPAAASQAIHYARLQEQLSKENAKVLADIAAKMG